MPPRFFLCEELQKHWPCVQLNASSKVSKGITDLNKMKQASSSTPIFSLQVFPYKTVPIMWTRCILRKTCCLEFLEFVPVLSFQSN